MKHTVRWLVSVGVACSTIVSIAACSSKKSSSSSSSDGGTTTPTDGSQSMAQLAGYGYSCALLTSAAGTSLNGKAFVRYLQLGSDGTYSFVSQVTEATACSSGHASGTGSGTVDTQYNVSGTYAIGGSAGTPSTATKLTFTPTSAYLTIYNPQTVSTAADIVTWANSACGSWGSTFSTSATSTKTFAPTSCSSTSTVVMGTPSSLSSAQYNIGYRSTNFQTGSLSDMWSPDAGMYPTAYSVTWQ